MLEAPPIFWMTICWPSFSDRNCARDAAEPVGAAARRIGHDHLQRLVRDSPVQGRADGGRGEQRGACGAEHGTTTKIHELPRGMHGCTRDRRAQAVPAALANRAQDPARCDVAAAGTPRAARCVEMLLQGRRAARGDGAGHTLAVGRFQLDGALLAVAQRHDDVDLQVVDRLCRLVLDHQARHAVAEDHGIRAALDVDAIRGERRGTQQEPDQRTQTDAAVMRCLLLLHVTGRLARLQAVAPGGWPASAGSPPPSPRSSGG